MKSSRTLDTHLRPGQFYGNVVAKRSFNGATLSDLRHAHGRRLPEHSHELAYFSLLLEGAYSERCGSKEITYQPWSIVYHPPAASHRDEIGSGGGRFFTVEVDGSWLERIREFGTVRDVAVHAPQSELVRLALRLLRELRCSDACSALAVEGLVLEMLAESVRGGSTGASRPPAWMGRVEELLREGFRERLTLDRLAAEAGVHPAHVARVFRRVRGRSIADYRRELRVQAACSSLADPETTLADVAAATGFADQSHFTRVFKKVTGMTPAAFRSLVRAQTIHPLP